MGISTLRNTFITWSRDTGEPLHNFIVWKDLRALRTCKDWNRRLSTRSFGLLQRIFYTLGGQQRHQSMANFRLTPGTPAAGILWMLQNQPEVREKMLQGKLMYGTVDTWLVYRLTCGQTHATESSNASITGLLDLHTLSWNQTLLTLFQLSPDCLPTLIASNGDFGQVNECWFGARVPITGVVGDQQAAMFGECCFDRGDAKLTLGTGAFLAVHTGGTPAPVEPNTGGYTVVGWQLDGELPAYLIESDSSDTGTSILWAQKLDFFDEPAETISLARSVPTSGGVYFVPAFSGLQAPVNDLCAVSSLIGLNPTTSKAHIVRAVLEAIVFRVLQMHRLLQDQLPDQPLLNIRANGGIANNDFIMQLIADLTGSAVERASSREMSSLGAAYMAGLGGGVWSSGAQLKKLRKVDVVFDPSSDHLDHYVNEFTDWQRAIERCLKWYSH
jgi:putative glycerol kinase 5